MPFEISWHDPEKTIIVIRIRGQIAEWEEHHAAFKKARELITSTPQPIYAIIASDSTARMPRQGSSLPHLSYNVSNIPENLKLVVSMIETPVERLMVDVIKAANCRKPVYDKLTSVTSLRRAFALIEKHRNNLNSTSQL
jgi:hypothetical protein